MRHQIRIKWNCYTTRYLKSLHFVQNRPNGSAGFTIAETMIVIAIIGLLTTIAVPTLLNYRSKATHALVISEIRLLQQEILLYQVNNMHLPDDLSDITLGNMSDPWGNPYQYLKIAEDDEDENDNGNGNGNGNDNDDDIANEENSENEKKNKPRKDHFLVPVNSDFDLYSMGKDGDSKAPFTAKASHDDIVRASNGKFIGLVTGF